MNLKQAIEQDDKKTLQAYKNILNKLFHQNQLSYWIGNPSVQITSGQIYLKPMQISVKFKDQGDIQCTLKQIKEKYRSKITNSCLILLGIPNSKTPLQICQSLKEFKSQIEQSRVIKTCDSGYYGFLMRFPNKQITQKFYDQYFCQTYNSIEIQRIILRQIIEITLNFDEFNLSLKKQFNMIRKKSTNESTRVQPDTIFMSYNTQIISEQNKGSFICAICLQQMVLLRKNQKKQTQHQGILSILCGHYFHWDCLEKWTQNTCPLCRYHQQPPSISICQYQSCNLTEGLWLCLICGQKLCSSILYDLFSSDSHIYYHYKLTSHSLSMEIQTKFIYDFSIKDFVHRVYYNELTGKPISLENIERKNKKNKMHDVIIQYQNLMKAQLQDQRKYFESNLFNNKNKLKQLLNQLENTKESLKTQINNIVIEEVNFEQIQNQNKELLKEIQTAQKYGKLLNDKCVAQMKDREILEQKEMQLEQQLKQLIKQKRQTYKEIQKNLEFNRQMKRKLKGDKILNQFFVNKKK